MGENKTKGKTLDIRSVLPYMEAFPYDNYEIVLEEEEDLDPIDISPILLNVFGPLNKDEKVTFKYLEKDSIVQISFYLDDVEYIAAASNKIKKMDSINEDLEKALTTKSLEEKIESIKRSKKFIKLLDSDHLLFAPFTEVLRDMLDLYDTSLIASQILGVQRLQHKKIEEEKLTQKQKDAVSAFFNFQLNYAKIILGIVIAVKIY